MRNRNQTELAVLRALEHGESYPKEIAKAAGIGKPTAWGTLQSLASRGLVRKSRVGKCESRGRPRQYWELTRFGVRELVERRSEVAG